MQEEELLRRVEELESRLEFSDQTITKLNDELYVHQQHLAQMQKQLGLITQRLGEPSFIEHAPEDEPPPPHY